MAKQSKELRDNTTERKDGFIKTVTTGPQAKTINLTTYVLLQLINDFSIFQEMVRYVVAEWREDYEGITEYQHQEPTTARVSMFLLFVTTAFWGGVISVYEKAAGPMLLLINLVAVMVFGYTVTLPKLIKYLSDNYWDESLSFALDDFFSTPGLTTNVATYGTYIGVLITTFWLFWCIYCSIIVMLENAGFKGSEEISPSTEALLSQSVLPSEIDATEASAFLE